jgi:hypothetical protein
MDIGDDVWIPTHIRDDYPMAIASRMTVAESSGPMDGATPKRHLRQACMTAAWGQLLKI